MIQKQNQKILELEKLLQERERELEIIKQEFKKIKNERGLRLEHSRRGLEITNRELAEINSQLVKVNEELKEARVNLEAKVKERTKELEKRTKELEESKIALVSILEDVEDSRKALMNILEDVEEERKKVEEEKNKTVNIIKNLTDGLLVFDQENKISFINPQAEILLSVKAEEVINKQFSDLTIFPNFKLLIEALLSEKKEKIYRQELEINPNLILEISFFPILIQKDKTGKLIILHDITREKIVERLKTEFVSLAAHQLRTPLSAIKWTLRSLLDGDLGEITSEQRNFLEKTYISNERMISLINDLLNVTRIEEGRYLYKLAMANIEEITAEIINRYKDETNRKKIKFEFLKPSQKMPEVFIDAEKINLAIQNLIENAICYTISESQIVISLSVEEKNIKFSIKDGGIGIPEDEQEKIFTKFFRAQNAKKIDTEGSGLGLFITKNIVEAHGGKIWFESKENQGTTFYFTLPIKESFS